MHVKYDYSIIYIQRILQKVKVLMTDVKNEI